MKYLTPLIPFALGFLLLQQLPIFNDLVWLNGILQLMVFVLLASLPALRHGRMSYVDLAWPWGLVLLGLFTLISSPAHGLRVWLASGMYILMGLRMGLGAVKMWQMGGLNTELPRYQYQRRRWRRAGKHNISLAIQVEILLQAVATASFLAIPLYVMAVNPKQSISVMAWIGLSLWVVALVMETVADVQKLKFLHEMRQAEQRNQVCDVGLWAYSRHPNYFAEWMAWNALVIMALPSWFHLLSSQPVVLWLTLGVSLMMVSYIMFSTLVFYTGAVPAEFYSAQKRPAYLAYQKTTNRFFPGPKK